MESQQAVDETASEMEASGWEIHRIAMPDIEDGKKPIDGSAVIIGRGLSREQQFNLLESFQGSNIQLYFHAPEFRQLSAVLGIEYKGICVVPIPTSSPGRWYELRRRILDLIFSVFVIVGFLIPFTLFLGPIIVLTSSGPVFYSTTVVGQRGKPFVWRKFRSMRIQKHSELTRNQLVARARSAHAKGESGSTKIVDRSRITLIGQIIRKTSVDELPQFFNVLKGDMTLVGPRPSFPYEFDQAESWQQRRAIPKAGITGVWGVYGRSIVHFDEQVAMDICGYYQRSTLGDIALILRTVQSVTQARGAE